MSHSSGSSGGRRRFRYCFGSFVMFNLTLKVI